MEEGYVLGFSDKKMAQFFEDEYKIAVYDEKYNFDFSSKSKANRLRGIWKKEDDKTVGAIILSLVGCAESDLLTKGGGIPSSEKDLINKARDIGLTMLFSEFSEDSRPEVQAMKNKSQLIKEFNATDFKSLETDERIYLLKVFYSYYEAIVAAYYGSGLFFVSSGIDNLNDYFKILRKRLCELVDMDDTFSEIKNGRFYEEVIDPMTSLYSSAEFLDVTWDIMYPAIINLREEIADKDLFENNSEIHKVGSGISNFLNEISKEIDTLKKYLNQKTKNFYEKEMPNTKEQFDNSSNSKDGQVVRHEVKHFFENSIQEKPIDLHHKHDNDTGKKSFYITKKGDDFFYKGQYLSLSKTALYYTIFCALYAKLPEGGEITYDAMGNEIKSRLPLTKGKSSEDMRKYIQDNLTGNSNGFMRYAKIPENEDNGRPLIEIVRGKGIIFNNKKG